MEELVRSASTYKVNLGGLSGLLLKGWWSNESTPKKYIIKKLVRSFFKQKIFPLDYEKIIKNTLLQIEDEEIWSCMITWLSWMNSVLDRWVRCKIPELRKGVKRPQIIFYFTIKMPFKAYGCFRLWVWLSWLNISIGKSVKRNKGNLLFKLHFFIQEHELLSVPVTRLKELGIRPTFVFKNQNYLAGGSCLYIIME